MRSSCIHHPVNQPLLVTHQWQYEFCKDLGRSADVGAAVLSILEYWHNIKLRTKVKNEEANKQAAFHGDKPLHDISLLQWHTYDELRTMIMRPVGDSTLSKVILFLKEKKVVTVTKNPNKRYKFDQKNYYLFRPEVLNNFLKERYSRSGVSHSRPGVTITETTETNTTPTTGNDFLENGLPTGSITLIEFCEGFTESLHSADEAKKFVLSVGRPDLSTGDLLFSFRKWRSSMMNKGKMLVNQEEAMSSLKEWVSNERVRQVKHPLPDLAALREGGFDDEGIGFVEKFVKKVKSRPLLNPFSGLLTKDFITLKRFFNPGSPLYDSKRILSLMTMIESNRVYRKYTKLSDAIVEANKDYVYQNQNELNR
jgi:hypothetical protein